MTCKVILRLKKYALKPNLLLLRIGKIIKIKISYNKAIKSARKNGIETQFGIDIQFLQKTIFTGKGTVVIGDSCSFGYILGGHFYKGLCEIQPRYKNSLIKFGNGIATNNNLFICCAGEIIIDDAVLIGEDVMIIDHDAHGIHPQERRSSIGNTSPIHIKENVWIGSRVIILPGTTIGKNTIVAAGAVVKGTFPSNVIIGGCPAKVIKEL